MSKIPKYTTFSPPASAKNALLNRLFASHANPDQLPPQLTIDPGKEIECAAAVRAIATAPIVNGIGGLLPNDGIQQGNSLIFPNGVDYTFAGRSLDDPTQTPDISQVSWKVAGDPANPYIPDLSSPGPGKTAGTDKDVDPQISTQDVKPNYIPGQPNSATRNPVVTGAKIAAAINAIDISLVKGNSGANN
jgi:hypothetical protein